MSPPWVNGSFYMRNQRSYALLLCVCLLALLPAGEVRGCSEVYISGSGNCRVSARNFDFFRGDGTVRFSPANMTRQSQYVPPGHPPLKWVVKYPSISFNTVIPRTKAKNAGLIEAGVDGINRKGLKIGTYFLMASVFPRTGPETCVDICSLPQYLLDNCGTVAEALESLNSGVYRVTATPTDDLEILLHLFLHDTTGNSAIVEYLDGKLQVTVNPEITVLTNTIYAESLAALNTYQGFGGERTVPGGPESLDRFVRGAYYLRNLASPADPAQAMDFGFAIIQILSVSPGFPSGISTYWSIVTDLDTHRILFRTQQNPGIAGIDLDRLADEGRRTIAIDLLRTDLSGDISHLFLEGGSSTNGESVIYIVALIMAVVIVIFFVFFRCRRQDVGKGAD